MFILIWGQGHLPLSSTISWCLEGWVVAYYKRLSRAAPQHLLRGPLPHARTAPQLWCLLTPSPPWSPLPVFSTRFPSPCRYHRGLHRHSTTSQCSPDLVGLLVPECLLLFQHDQSPGADTCTIRMASSSVTFEADYNYLTLQMRTLRIQGFRYQKLCWRRLRHCILLPCYQRLIPPFPIHASWCHKARPSIDFGADKPGF